MMKLFRDKKGLSTVVTTLIILVVSVLITGSVTYYTTNVTQARSQEEQVQIRQAQLWVNSTGSEAAFYIVNTGGRDVVINKITIRGLTVPWNNIWVERASAVDGITNINNDLNVTKSVMTTSNSTITISVNSAARTFTLQSGKFTLKSSEGIVLYIKSPASIAIGDIGLSMTSTVYSTQTSWTTETNVKSAS